MSVGVVTPSGASFGHEALGLQVHESCRSRLKFQATAAASSGVPSVNFTPWRSEIVSVLPPSESWEPAAIWGSGSPFGPRRNSWPKIASSYVEGANPPEAGSRPRSQLARAPL